MKILLEGKRSRVFEQRPPNLWWFNKKVACFWCECVFILEKEDRSKINTVYRLSDPDIEGRSSVISTDRIVSCPECFIEISLFAAIPGIAGDDPPVGGGGE